MNKKGEFYAIIGMMVYYDFYYKNPCLERVAKDICNKYSSSFDKLDWMLGEGFICKKDIHIQQGERFIFTKQELKGCKY